jgi:hypothetical protein
MHAEKCVALGKIYSKDNFVAIFLTFKLVQKQ